ncbi:MAG: DUF4139 domain-containing protein [Bacteroidales bacterium]|nr:DUF4139 domain-containing protein [Bacteroidales bacterium]MDD4739344.1 DUF4139 domain-containing protein [Bacteroidales bacterium]
MKRILFSLFVLGFSLSGLKAQQKIYPQINKVTIFRQTAQIEKSLEVSLVKGYNEIILSGNSSMLNPQSIQFNSSKDFVITDFSPYIQLVKSNQKQEDKLTDKEKARVNIIKDSIEILRDKRQAVRDKIDVLMEEKSTLSNIKEIDSPQKADSIKDVKEALEYFEAKTIEISKLLYDLNDVDIDLHKQIRKQKEDLKIILQEDEQGEKLSKKEYYIKLNLYAKNNVKTKVNYKYNVSGIDWTPIYDIKFSSLNKPAVFLLKAEFQQETGEDWTDVSIVFSTEEQSTNLKPVDLQPMVYKKKIAGERPKTVATVSTVDDIASTSETGKRITNEEIERMTAETVDGIIATVGGVSDNDGGTTRGEGSMVTYVNGVAKKGSVNIPKHAIAEEQVELGGTRASQGDYKQRMAGNSVDYVTAQVGGISENRKIQEDKPAYEIITENASKGMSSSNNLLTQEYDVKMKYSIKSGDKSKIIPLEEKKTNVNYKYFSVPKKEKVVYLAALFPLWEELGLANARANLYIDDKYVNSAYIITNQTADTLKLFVGREKKIAIDRKVIKGKPIEANRKGTELEQVINVKVIVKNNNNTQVDIKIDDQIPISNSEKITIAKGELSGANYNEKTGLLFWETSLKPLESKTFTFSYTCKYPKDVVLPLD